MYINCTVHRFKRIESVEKCLNEQQKIEREAERERERKRARERK